jgi:hypothetical protein
MASRYSIDKSVIAQAGRQPARRLQGGLLEFLRRTPTQATLTAWSPLVGPRSLTLTFSAGMPPLTPATGR